MKQPDSKTAPTRRALLQTGLGAGALLATGLPAFAAAPPGFDQWRDNFHARARAKGISDATWARVMGRIEPDMSVFRQMQKQPEFHEHPLVQQNHMRPIFPALAALAWNEPRRRAYWETELINALKIVDRGWGTPEEMRGSWAGAMGHTQWMPEVWLNVGMDYDKDGRVSPFGKPDDALGSSARYLLNRGKYHRGEHWGYEVRSSGGSSSGSRTYAAWASAGVTRADGKPFPQPNASAQMWVPVAGGPSFLLGPNFYSVKSYNPSMNYALAICHLGDRILGAPPFTNPFPGSERALTLPEVQELQTRLTKAGFDTGGTDGRVGNDTMKAVKDYQTKMGLLPADGYGGLKVLARLRQGG
jgi:membrane-bound lytic murein transglycosylase B